MLVVAAKRRNKVGKDTKDDGCAAKLDKPEEPGAPLKEKVEKAHLANVDEYKILRGDVQEIELGLKYEDKKEKKSEREKRRKIEEPFIPLCHYRICA
jgi:hypothetical protein